MVFFRVGWLAINVNGIIVIGLETTPQLSTKSIKFCLGSVVRPFEGAGANTKQMQLAYWPVPARDIGAYELCEAHGSA